MRLLVARMFIISNGISWCVVKKIWTWTRRKQPISVNLAIFEKKKKSADSLRHGSLALNRPKPDKNYASNSLILGHEVLQKGDNFLQVHFGHGLDSKIELEGGLIPTYHRGARGIRTAANERHNLFITSARIRIKSWARHDLVVGINHYAARMGRGTHKPLCLTGIWLEFWVAVPGCNRS